MKKIITIFSAIFFAVSAMAQTMNVHFKNGTKVEFSSENVEYVDFTEKPSDPTLTPGDYVDLGLSVKWATCNLGSSTPAGTGGYYAWGETSTKTYYSESTYSYYITGTGYTDIGNDISGTTYDAAMVNLGGDWRMPTKAEFQELLDNCTWTYGQNDGVYGYYVTGKNGNSIFLPKKKVFFESSINSGLFDEFNSYLSSTQYDSSKAYNLNFKGDTVKTISRYQKCYGLQIRPVYSPSNSDGIQNITDYVTVSRTGQGTTVTGSGTYYTVTFSIKNSSTETIHLVSLAGVSIDRDLEAGATYSTTLQGSTTYIQNYYQELVFTYNGKSYTVKG